MQKTSLIAAAMALAVAGAPMAATASATVQHDPIAHIAVAQHDPIAHMAVHVPAITAAALHSHRAGAAVRACAAEPHRALAGEHVSSFTKCVHALRALRHHHAKTPRQACHLESRHHLSGSSTSPFTRCVVAARAFEKTLA